MKLLRTLLFGAMLGSHAFAQSNPGWQNYPAETLAEVVNRLGSAPSAQASAPSTPPPPAQSSQPLALQQLGMSQACTALVAPTATLGGNVADEITPEISNLARGLRYDPTLIYAFVRNRIDFAPYYGCKKGAHLTLMEMSGNDMDQSALLVALLRASGYSPSYRSGPVAFFPNQHILWNGISPTPFPYLSDAAFAAAIGTTTSDPQLANERVFYGLTIYLATFGYPIVERVNVPGVGRAFGIPHVWVEVSVDGTTYQLSPSYKEHNWLTGIDLVSATGFNKGQMLAAADAETGTGDPDGVNWVKNLDYSAISNQLETYTSNFLSYIRTNHDTMDADEVFPGKHLVQKPILSLADADPLIIYNNTWATSETWNLTAIPPSRMSKLKITAGTYNAGSENFSSTLYDQTREMPELQGKRLALSFDGGLARVHLDESLVGSTFSPGGTSFDLRLTATHDHYTWAYDSNAGQYVKTDTERGNQETVQSYRKNDAYTYAIPYAFDDPSKLIRARQKVLAEYQRDGLTFADDWEVRAETLNLIGLEWYAQTWRTHQMVAGLDGGVSAFAHRFGRVAQEGSFYIDIACQAASSQHRGLWDVYSRNIDRMSALFMSAMEHGAIEQLQGESAGAASTVRVIHEANEEEQRIYRATSANWTSISSGISGYDDLPGIATEVANGATALLPASGNTTVGAWEGEGYALETSSSTQMRISDGLNGGYSIIPGPADTLLLVLWGTSDPAWDVSAGNTLNLPYKPLNTPQMASWDPIDLLSGAYFLDKNDLSLSGTGPLGLDQTRHYNSHLSQSDAAGMGYGWTHGNSIFLEERSSSRAALGATNTYQMAPMAVAALAAGALHFEHTTANEWANSAMVVHWLVEQMRYNAVALTIGRQTLEFIRMPDGSYVSPPGMKLTLVKNTDGTFLLTKRHDSLFEFNADGKVTSIRNYNGAEKEFSYDGTGKLTTVEDEFSRALTYTWSSGRISSISDGTGRSISYGYTNGDLTSFTDVEGKVWTYQYDADHRMTSLKDPESRTIAENDYDSEDRVIRQRSMGDSAREWQYTWSGFLNTEENPQCEITAYAYDERGRNIVVTNDLLESSVTSYDGQDRIFQRITPEGESTISPWNADHNAIGTVDPEGHTELYFYDSQLRLQTLRDKKGHDTVFTYTANHQLETITDPENNVTSHSYHPNGLLHTVTDGENKVTTTTYDTWGRPNKMTRHDGTFDTFVNNERGDLLTSTDSENRTITNTWNKRRQILTTTAPSISGQQAAIITNTYSDSGNLESIEDTNGNITSYTWNAIGKPLTSTVPALAAGDNVVTTTYDTRDWIEKTSNSLGHIMRREYDAAHRMIAIIDPLTRRSETTFDSNGRPLESKDPLNRVTKSAWTSRGEMEEATDGKNETSDYVFDENGNRTTLTNRRGKTYTQVYDNSNRLTTSTTPTGKVTTITYFGNDLIETIEEPSGQTSTFAYNGKNLVSSRADPNGTISYGYDDSGMLRTLTEGSDVITRTYDERGKIKTYTNADGDQLQYRYDGEGNLTRLTYPDGRHVHYTYNARNLMETVTDWNSRETSYSYDRLGRLVGITRPNGTSAVVERDSGDQITAIREISSGKLFSYLRFEHDLAGQIGSRFRAPVVYSGFEHPTFTGTYDDDNRLASVNGQSVVHDADANMILGPIREDSGSLSLTYNSRNQLENADGLSYLYDAEGHRRSSTGSTGTTRYTIDPNANLSRLLVKHAPDGSVTYYVYGIGLLYEVDEIEKTKTYHFDQVGSTIVRTDDSAKVIGRAEYSAYGLLVKEDGDMDTPFLYNGQWGIQTDTNGLLCMRARYYSPYLMRFLNADPVAFSGGSNWFAYADGNPISTLDPFGLWGWRNSISLALDFIPVVGTVKAAVEVVAGYDFVAGEDVNRGIAAAGLVAGLVPGGKAALKGGSEAVEFALKHGDEVADAAAFTARHGDEAPVRVTQFFDDTKSFPVNGSEALHSSGQGLNKLDGIPSEGATWVVPKSADEITDWARHQTGVGNRNSYVEFNAYPSELTSAGGLKFLQGQAGYQSYLNGVTNLSGRGATFGQMGTNWLDAAIKGGFSNGGIQSINRLK